MLAGLFCFGIVVGCKRETPPPPAVSVAPPAPSAHVSSPLPAASAAASAALGVVWEEPSSFQRVPKQSAVRKATYLVPRAKGDAQDAELVVFYFGPGQGGGVDANVTRWVQQFEGAKPSDVHRADRNANGLVQHTVEIDKGTFSSQMPGDPSQPRPDFALLGAIVEAPSGSYFFKLTGPRATVKAARDAFYRLLDSVKPTP
ncbi:MAG: hypothetical protein QM773_10450 [Hyphomonadaceae bacterium]